MDLTELGTAVAGADTVVAVGARTQWDVGAPVEPATEVRAPAGVVSYEPDDMTITVGAGTTFAELDATLMAHGQACALDPRAPEASVGGIVACGLSGLRRLGHGPLRDHVLEVRFVRADGRLVKGGGPTVKNVTGYDLVRLMVGSLGTLGVIVQLTLRCRPRAAYARWFTAGATEPGCYRPAAVLWDGETTCVLLEGTSNDVAEQARGLRECEPCAPPAGAHRGRISVAPAHVRAVGENLAAVAGLRWCAELGVGTVHVATDEPGGLAAARAVAHAHGGWMLREAGGRGIDAFGRALPNVALMRRIKAAFDPTGKLAPGRLPL